MRVVSTREASPILPVVVPRESSIRDARARANAVDVDAGKFMLEREEYLFVDCRSWKGTIARITKPPTENDKRAPGGRMRAPIRG